MLEWVPSPIRERLWSAKHRLIKSLARQGFVESLHCSLDRQLTEMRISTVLDVGANRGIHGKLLRRIGYRGRIISFEPVASMYGELARIALADGNWEAHQCALGDVDGRKMEINIMASDVFSSFLAPSPTGRELFSADIQVDRSETVEIRRADAVLPHLVSPDAWPTTHVKIDTQGFDRAVLNGFGKLLPKVRSLQIEVSLVALYEGADESLAHVTELMQSGFALTAFFPVARDTMGRVLEADALFRRVFP